MKIIRKETILLDHDEWELHNGYYDFISKLTGVVGDENVKRLLSTMLDTMDMLEESMEDE